MFVALRLIQLAYCLDMHSTVGYGAGARGGNSAGCSSLVFNTVLGGVLAMEARCSGRVVMHLPQVNMRAPLHGDQDGRGDLLATELAL